MLGLLWTDFKHNFNLDERLKLMRGVANTIEISGHIGTEWRLITTSYDLTTSKMLSKYWYRIFNEISKRFD